MVHRWRKIVAPSCATAVDDPSAAISKGIQSRNNRTAVPFNPASTTMARARRSHAIMLTGAAEGNINAAMQQSSAMVWDKIAITKVVAVLSV
jgi:hypothetical protein